MFVNENISVYDRYSARNFLLLLFPPLECLSYFPPMSLLINLMFDTKCCEYIISLGGKMTRKVGRLDIVNYTPVNF